MRLTLAEARELTTGVLVRLGLEREDAAIVADHYVDASARGLEHGGVSKVLQLVDRWARVGDRRQPIRVVQETAQSALIDGGDNPGMLVAYRAAELGIEKAKRHGIALVGANNTYLTGMFSYYLEMAAREDLVAMAAGYGSAVVAPYGAREARLGTNPIAFGFPSEGDPIIWDIGTSAIMQGELALARRLGELLPEGTAVDADGNPTRDPLAALGGGAVLPWGGHRGSGLSIVVQLLGMLCDAPALPPLMAEYGFLFLAFSPSLLMPVERFKARAAELADSIRDAAPAAGSAGARMPFERSAEQRRRAQREGIDVPDPIHATLVRLSEEGGRVRG